MVGSIIFFTLALSLADSAVLNREVRCSPCNYPPPPPPVPYYQSQQWSGLARSDDGAPQGVFSGAAASMTDPQVYSMASSQQNNQYLRSEAQYAAQQTDPAPQASYNQANNQYTANQQTEQASFRTTQQQADQEPLRTNQQNEIESYRSNQQSIEYLEPQSSDATTTEEPTSTTLEDKPAFGGRSLTYYETSNSNDEKKESNEETNQSPKYEASASQHVHDVADTKQQITPVAAGPLIVPEAPVNTQFQGVTSQQAGGQHFGVQSLHEAMNLAAFGLQAAEHQAASCPTCGKSSLAFSNAYSDSGNALALAING